MHTEGQNTSQKHVLDITVAEVCPIYRLCIMEIDSAELHKNIVQPQAHWNVLK